MKYTQAGYGDSCTWPMYAGHQLDPRNPDDGSEEYDDEEAEEEQTENEE